VGNRGRAGAQRANVLPDAELPFGFALQGEMTVT
jgi:hypothetical protein